MASDDFDYVRHLLLEKAAIVLDADEDYLIQTRLLPVALDLQLRTVPMLIDSLRGERGRGPITTAVVEALTTNETFFLRDVRLFAALRKELVPALVEARRRRKRLRIWSAAASTGQEAYSVAMILREEIPDVDAWDIRITGTDINQSVLDRATEGLYTQLEVNRGIPARSLLMHFDKRDARWQIKPALRSLCHFQYQNLIEPLGLMEPQDLVLLRNVLIYFDVPTKRRILTQVKKWMARDAAMVLGGAESTLGIDDSFHRVVYAGAPIIPPRSAARQGGQGRSLAWTRNPVSPVVECGAVPVVRLA